MTTTRFLDDAANLADLASQIPGDEQARWERFGHLSMETAFVGRVFVVYKPTGLTRQGHHKDPDILAVVKVLDYSCDSEEGARVHVQNIETEQIQVITHIPVKLFNTAVFVSVPPKTYLRWDASRREDGMLRRSLSFTLLVKSKNKRTFYSHGNHYLATPNDLKELYPSYSDFRF